MYPTKMKLNESCYIPAFSGTALDALVNNVDSYVGKNFRFYENKDNNVFDHPGLLVSGGHHFNNTGLAKKLNINFKENILLGDSGGYQFATGILEINKRDVYVEKIFKWLETNSNYALNIDIPLYAPSTSPSLANKKDKIKISCEHFDYFQKNQSGSTKYLNVQHGKTLEDLNVWYDAVKNYQFEGGWAVGGAIGESYYLLQSFFFLFYNKEMDKINDKGKLIHILGVSSPEVMVYIEYLQMKLNEQKYNICITYDSSTADISSAYGNYLIDIGINKIDYLYLDRLLVNINVSSPLPCNCPVCTGVLFNDFYKKENRNKNNGFVSLSYFHLTYHNLYQMLQFKNKIKNLISTKSYDIYSQYFSERNLYIFRVIDKCFEEKDLSFLQKNKYNVMSNKKVKYDININKKPLF